MRRFFEPASAPAWLKPMLASVRAALGDIWDAPLRLFQPGTESLPAAASYKGGLVYDQDQQNLAFSNGEEWLYLLSATSAPYESHIFDVGDETTALTIGTAKKTFRLPYDIELVHPDNGPPVRASLTTASSSGAVTVDINVDGGSILATKLTVDANEKSSVTAATPAALSDEQHSDDSEVTIDIDAAGTNAAGLKVTMFWRRFASPNSILLEGDMTDGDDLEGLEGDMTDGDDTLLLEAA